MPTTSDACVLKLRPLSKELQRISELELHEEPKRLHQDIQCLRDWLQKQAHLFAREDDQFLLCFLRGCKFSIQKAKEKLDNYYNLRTVLLDYYGNRDPMAADMQALLNSGAMLPLSNTNNYSGPTIILIRWSVCDPTIMHFNSLVRMGTMILDILMNEDDNAVIAGIQFLSDYENFSSGYILQMSPSNLSKSVPVVQSVYPIRIKKFDFINLPKYFDTLLALIKSVLSQKLKKRISLHSNDSDYTKILPASILPKEYGGTGESVQMLTEKWKKKIESYRAWFDEDSKYCSNNAIRSTETKGSAFGVDGTFRKLNFD